MQNAAAAFKGATPNSASSVDTGIGAEIGAGASSTAYVAPVPKSTSCTDTGIGATTRAEASKKGALKILKRSRKKEAKIARKAFEEFLQECGGDFIELKARLHHVKKSLRKQNSEVHAIEKVLDAQQKRFETNATKLVGDDALHLMSVEYSSS